MVHPREGWQGHGMPRRRFLAMSLVIVVIGYAGYRLLTRGERGGLAALAAITGES